MSGVDDVFRFIGKILPDLMDYGEDLYDLFSGDAGLAMAEIKDRRTDINRRRARNDEALRRKHQAQGDDQD